MRIAIIGSGSSAFAAAIYAAENGAKVFMIERDTIGGTCVNVGCVPSKILIRSAYVAHTQSSHPFEGIAQQSPVIQRRLLVDQQQRRVEELREAKYVNVLGSHPNITFIQGAAKFKNKNTLIIQQDDKVEELEVDQILIATGSSPHIPEIKGLKETPFWTSTEALQSDVLPKHLIILGGSIVAVELAQAFLRLGTKVTLLARSTLLSKEDPQIGEGLQTVFEHEGMRVLTHTVPTRVIYEDEKFSVNTGEEIIVGDKLLVATGRHANIQALALEEVGVKTDEEARILVDDHMRTNIDTVYAAGDCTTQPQYVYVAAAAGTRAAMNMLGKEVSLDLSLVPSVTFTDPQVATVGLTEIQANALGIATKSRTLNMENVPRALANFDSRGFIKLVAEEKTGRIIGAQIFAPEAGEMIQTVLLAIRKQMTVNELASQLFPYLTMSEGLKLCAQIFTSDVKKLSCCADTGVYQEESPVLSQDFERIADTLATVLRGVYSNNPEGYTKILSLLANGKSITVDDIACSFGYPSLLMRAFLHFRVSSDNFDYDEKGDIIGIGLTLKPTKHQFNIRGNDLYTWCALDTLLFPLMLNETAHVSTPCPITGTQISFTITPEGIINLSPKNAVISFVVPSAQAAKSDIRKSFCQFANLFKDEDAAREWQKRHPEALILSSKEAFEFTKRVAETLSAKQNKVSVLFHTSFFRTTGFRVTSGLVVCTAAYLLMQDNSSKANLIISFVAGALGGYALGSRNDKDIGNSNNASCCIKKT